MLEKFLLFISPIGIILAAVNFISAIFSGSYVMSFFHFFVLLLFLGIARKAIQHINDSVDRVSKEKKKNE